MISTAKKELIFSPSGRELPIRVAMQDIYKLHLRQVVQFPKQFKPTLGNDIRAAILDLTNEINRAIKLYNKQTALRDADIALENLRDRIWVAYELRCISEGQMGEWAEKLSAVGRMLGGWIQAVSDKQNGQK